MGKLGLQNILDANYGQEIRLYETELPKKDLQQLFQQMNSLNYEISNSLKNKFQHLKCHRFLNISCLQ
jgi:hypothetical protein